jgi:hypothetical protein
VTNIEVPHVPIPTTPTSPATPSDMTENLQVAGPPEPEVAATGQRVTAILLAIIGGVWWAAGAASLEGPAWIVLLVLGLAEIVALVVISVRTLGVEGSAELFQRNRRKFNVINAIQAVAIITVVVGCGQTKNEAWMMPLVAIIVGLHFLPFAAMFHWLGNRWMGLALIAVGLVGCVLAATASPIKTVFAITGLGSASVLWAGAWSLVLDRRRSASY